MIMTLQAGDRLMSLTDVSEMLGIPVHTLYRWRYKGDGPVGYRVGRHVRYRREAVEAWLEQRAAMFETLIADELGEDGVGAFLVWVPIALYLGFTGHWGKAALLALWGGAIVSTIDNFLYPILIGPRLRQHTVAVLVSILGGVAFFGVTGIVLGPVFFSVASTLLEIWKQQNAEEHSLSPYKSGRLPATDPVPD